MVARLSAAGPLVCRKVAYRAVVVRFAAAAGRDPDLPAPDPPAAGSRQQRDPGGGKRVVDLLWGRMLRQPERHEIAAPIEEQLIIEHYAR